MFNKFNKNVIIKKSQYNLANQFILNSALNRIDKNNYNVKILETEKSYKIIVSRKLERV